MTFLIGSVAGISLMVGGIGILAVMLILLTGVLLAYVQAAYASGSSLIYVILRRKKDDENLLEWEDPSLEEPLDFGDDDQGENAEESPDQKPADFARISTIGSRSSRSRCHRYGSARETFRNWSSISLGTSRKSTIGGSTGFR